MTNNLFFSISATCHIEIRLSIPFSSADNIHGDIDDHTSDICRALECLNEGVKQIVPLAETQ